MAYSVGYVEGGRLPKSHSKTLSYLNQIGFKTSSLTKVVEGWEGSAKSEKDTCSPSSDAMVKSWNRLMRAKTIPHTGR